MSLSRSQLITCCVLLLAVVVLSITLFGRSQLSALRHPIRVPLPASGPSKTYDNDKLFFGVGLHVELPVYWVEVHKNGSYLLLLSDETATEAAIPSATSVERQTHVQVGLMDTQSLTPKAWIAQGRTLYACDDPQWLHIDSVPAVRCATVLVNYPFGIIALTQVYAFTGKSSAVSIQLALSEQDRAESKALHQQELDRIFSSLHFSFQHPFVPEPTGSTSVSD